MSERNEVNHNRITNNTYYEGGDWGGDSYTTERHDHHHLSANSTSSPHVNTHVDTRSNPTATGNRNHIQIDNRAGGLTTGMLVVGSVAVVGMLALALAAFAAALVAVSVVLAGLAGTSGLALAKMHYDAKNAPHLAQVEIARIVAQERVTIAMIHAHTYRPQLPPPPAQHLLTAGEVETVDGLFVEKREYAEVGR